MDYDREKVAEWIETFWKSPRKCPVCGEVDKWLLMEKVWELREFRGGDFVVGAGPVMPVVALMCNVCGHTVFFNAIAAKAVERSKPQEERK
jgi:hypothetical protein